jgi:hypothetical protein
VNNVLLTPGTGFVFSKPVADIVATHNLVVAGALSSGLAGFDATNTTTTDPQFVDVAARNYLLMGSSPAVDSGSTLIPLTFDINGRKRPSGGGIDRGAFEFVP